MLGSHLRRGSLQQKKVASDAYLVFKDIVDSALETHLASVREEITDLRLDMDPKFAEVDARFTAVEEGMDRLEAKIDHVDEKLGNFENREIAKWLQLEVRVERLEKQGS